MRQNNQCHISCSPASIASWLYHNSYHLWKQSICSSILQGVFGTTRREYHLLLRSSELCNHFDLMPQRVRWTIRVKQQKYTLFFFFLPWCLEHVGKQLLLEFSSSRSVPWNHHLDRKIKKKCLSQWAKEDLEFLHTKGLNSLTKSLGLKLMPYVKKGTRPKKKVKDWWRLKVEVNLGILTSNYDGLLLISVESGRPLQSHTEHHSWLHVQDQRPSRLLRMEKSSLMESKMAECHFKLVMIVVKMFLHYNWFPCLEP